MRIVRHFGLHCLLLLSAIGAQASLRFKPDGTFKIVQLTDLHLGEARAKDERTLQVRSLQSWMQSRTV